MGFSVVLWSDAVASQVMSFLRQYEDTSLFLLNNLHSFGPRLNSAPNSGNFNIILNDQQEIAAIFVLSRRGNLLLQTNRGEDYSVPILDQIQKESVAHKGIFGAWEVVQPLWEEAQRRSANLKAKLFSKEILFRLVLEDLEIKSLPEIEIRSLRAVDFDQWSIRRLEYLKEVGLSLDLSAEQFHEVFLKLIKDQELWGCFREGQLLSMAGLNARYNNLGQVGGVFTVHSERGKGYAKEVMKKLMKDCREIHKIQKLILFTDEKNVAAQAVYDGLGFERIGHFGIILMD